MKPKAKYAVIYHHRNEYSVSVMCRFFEVSKSGYYSFVHRLGQPEKDAELAEQIRQQQKKCFCTYGYRRMWLALDKKGIHHNSKTVLRVMKKYDLLSEIRRRRKWVNMGRQIHKYENLLNRQFEADELNSKWVTDISYIHTKQGVLYLVRNKLLIWCWTQSGLLCEKRKRRSLQSCSSTATHTRRVPGEFCVNRISGQTGNSLNGA